MRWLTMLCTALITCLPMTVRFAQQPSCPLWVAPSMQKIFREDPPPASAETVLRLSAAPGEREAAQIVLRSPRKAQLVDVTISNLQAAGGVRLGAEVVTVYRMCMATVR